MKFAFRGVSGAALLLGLAGGFQSSWAQQTPAQPTPGGPQTVTAGQQGPQAAPQASGEVEQTASSSDQQEGATDRVVIIGSLIATKAEDAPKPVEVITADDLKDQGSPNVTEFIRSLTAATPNISGTAFTNTGAAILGNGFNSVDLRGQGANGTLVLMNGRRLATTNGGAGADVNTIPLEALGRVEVLKDGASATYGAGAVGGVINFATRRDVDAPQISYQRTLYDGSEGGSKLTLMTGWVGDASNFLVVGSHETEGSLMAYKRDYSSAPFSVNPALYSIANTSQRFLKQSNFATAAPTNVTTGAGGGTFGASFNDFTSDADCHTLGGELTQTYQQGTGGTVPTGCGFPLYRVTELVSEFTQDQVFTEFNGAINDNMEFHFDFTYSKYDSEGKRPPSGANALTARIADSNINAVSCAASCFMIVPFSQAVYTAAGAATATTVQNPFVANFNSRIPGATNDLAAGQALFTSSYWRPYLFGGNPLWGDGLARSHVTRERELFNVGLNGEFDSDGILSFMKGVHYDFNAQFNQYVQTNVENGDWLLDRLQNAIMGYGGPACRAIDRVRTDYSSAAAYNRTVGIQSDTAPGTNGCMWFNPFQSNFKTSIFNGAANPNFPTSGSPNWGVGATQAVNTGPDGFINDKALVDWIWATRRSEVQYQSNTYDFVLTGEIPWFELPGGAIGWAAGTQWRQTERRGLVQEQDQAELALLLERCPYDQQPGPNSRACSTSLTGGATGDFFSGATAIQPNPGLNPPDYIDSQTLAYLAELQLPILDRLNASFSWRREEFNGGDITGTIWGTAAKYDITDNLYVRGSYSTNFRAEGVLDAVPGAQVLTSVTENSSTRFGNFTYSRLTTTADNIEPEDDKTMNLGIGWNSELFGGRLRATANFFKIDVEGQEVTTLATTVLSNVFHTDTTATNPNAGPNPETTAANVGTQNYRADCSARLASMILWKSGSCVQGATTGADIDFVLSSDQNGPSLHTEGIDYSLDYSYPLFDGTAFFSLDWTVTTKYEAEGYSVNGVPFDLGGDRLGFFNGLQSGSASQKQRVNSSIRWANDEHNIGLLAHYQSGYNNDPGTFDVVNGVVLATTLTPTVNLAGTANDRYSLLSPGGKDYIDYDLNYIWTPKFLDGMEFRASVLNVTDRDPVLAQYGNGGAATTGYIPQLGNPRGRRVELGLTKKF